MEGDDLFLINLSRCARIQTFFFFPEPAKFAEDFPDIGLHMRSVGQHPTSNTSFFKLECDPNNQLQNLLFATYG